MAFVMRAENTESKTAVSPMPQPPQCTCVHKELRRRIYANGTVVATYQCLNCGGAGQNVPKRETNVEKLPPWNADLVKRWKDRCDAHWSAQKVAYERQREEENRQFWERYHQHMQSAKWQSLRQRVFRRSKGLCEGCGERNAVQVHHLDYQRLGDEMLFDLVAVCMSCHEKIHGHPIG